MRTMDAVISSYGGICNPFNIFHAQVFGEDTRLCVLLWCLIAFFSTALVVIRSPENLTKTQLYVHGVQDRDWFLDMFPSLFKGSPINGCQRRLERHREHFG